MGTLAGPSFLEYNDEMNEMKIRRHVIMCHMPCSVLRTDRGTSDDVFQSVQVWCKSLAPFSGVVRGRT